MKKYLQVFLIMLSVYSAAYSQNYWLRVPTPTTYDFYKCSTTDSMNIWVAGDSAFMYHSSDGGINWVIQNPGLTPNYRLTELFFLNERLGWTIAYDIYFGGTVLLRTTNGGINWTNLNFADTVLNTIYFIDSANGFIGDWSGGSILKTTNAGANWIRAVIDSGALAPKNKFNFYNSQVGICCGGLIDAGGPIWKTTDSGFNWFKCAEEGVPMFDIVFLDFNNIIAAGGEFDIGATFTNSTDNGTAWNSMYYGILAIGKSVAVRTRSEIWVPLGFHGGWEVSFDSTKTWQIIPSDSNVAINDTRFSDPYHGWAVGSYGRLFKFNKEAIGIRNPQKNIPAAYKLYQNYPNPFNPTTTIIYEIPDASEVTITVYDMLGRKISTLVDKQQIAGSYKVEFDGSNLPSGVYFYKLSAGGYSISKKMILIK